MNTFESLKKTIQARRSSKPAEMNGQKINNNFIQQLLELADWAPTHGRTEPWRFIVFEDLAKQQFCLDHAELYKANTDPEKYSKAKYEKLKEQGDTPSHIMIVYMKRTTNNAIPVLEEIAAVSASIQNILLGAAAQNISALWSTGGMMHHPSMKKQLDLAVEDVIMGLLLLGYSDQPIKEGIRKIPLESKIVWKK